MNMDELRDEIKQYGLDFINQILDVIAELHPLKHHPVSNVRWVAIDKVIANDYNPNAVAPRELNLLAISIAHDGYTQPIVTIYDKAQDKYVIVDGYHRYFVVKHDEKIRASTNGLLPIVVISKDINDRIASTVRHNRARGKHAITGMGMLVFKMLENGWTDTQICNELGLEADELVRLKFTTGIAKLYEGKDFSRSWETHSQIKERHKKD